MGDFLHPTERDQTCNYRMGTDQGMIYTAKAAKAAVQINVVECGKWRRDSYGANPGEWRLKRVDMPRGDDLRVEYWSVRLQRWARLGAWGSITEMAAFICELFVPK